MGQAAERQPIPLDNDRGGDLREIVFKIALFVEEYTHI